MRHCEGYEQRKAERKLLPFLKRTRYRAGEAKNAWLIGQLFVLLLVVAGGASGGGAHLGSREVRGFLTDSCFPHGWEG